MKVLNARSYSEAARWPRTRLPRKRRPKPLGTRPAPLDMPRPRPTCTLSQNRTRSNTSWALPHTQHARRTPAGIEVLEQRDLSRLASERRLLLLQCSGATPPPRRAEPCGRTHQRVGHLTAIALSGHNRLFPAKSALTAAPSG
jgi:hypothetical protein